MSMMNNPLVLNYMLFELSLLLLLYMDQTNNSLETYENTDQLDTMLLYQVMYDNHSSYYLLYDIVD